MVLQIDRKGKYYLYQYAVSAMGEKQRIHLERVLPTLKLHPFKSSTRVSESVINQLLMMCIYSKQKKKWFHVRI